MSIELKIPQLGESIQEVQIAHWIKSEGDAIEEGEDVVELETDKASVELPAPADGVVSKILKQDGESVAIGDTIALIEENGKPPKEKKPKRDAKKKSEEKPAAKSKSEEPDRKAPPVTPSARRALREFDVRAEDVDYQGKRLRREDVLRHVDQTNKTADEKVAKRNEPEPSEKAKDAADLEEVVPMSLLRRRIAKRLVEAQQTAALLTTFNEIDMTEVIELRKLHRERFQDRYGVKLGFMSFFMKGVIDALRQFPEINAEIRENDIVYRNYYHIGIAIGGERGLVVPVLRHAERMSFAEIERAIDDFAKRAQKRDLRPEELEGGTFTITNGGIFGSLLSTPIVNPPQSGVLGMHAIQERPVARNGEVVIRPMMYVALTYDHRVVDGRGAVSFLRRLKEAIEEPARMLIEA